MLGNRGEEDEHEMTEEDEDPTGLTRLVSQAGGN